MMANHPGLYTSQIVEIDGELFLPLPDFALKRLDVRVGDEFAIRYSVGVDGIQITRTNSDFEKVMEIANKIMDEERSVLAELAKS